MKHILYTALGLSAVVSANTLIDESLFNDGEFSLLFQSGTAEISNEDTDDGQGIGHAAAVAGAPVWFFGRPRGSNPCYPSPGEINGAQAPGNSADWGNHGNLGEGCPNPGAWSGHNSRGNSFPTYYEAVRCPDGTYRTTYSIYFRHDSGHANDWESTATVWAKAENGQWRRDRLLLGQHGKWKSWKWADIQNTVNGPADQLDQGAKDRDHPKVYVGSFYHAIFQDRYTGLDFANPADPGREFRSQDWLFFPQGRDIVRGSLIDPSWNYGSADTTPPSLRPGGTKDICRQ